MFGVCAVPCYLLDQENWFGLPAALEFSVRVSDSLAGGVLPVLILDQLLPQMKRLLVETHAVQCLLALLPKEEGLFSAVAFSLEISDNRQFQSLIVFNEMVLLLIAKDTGSQMSAKPFSESRALVFCLLSWILGAVASEEIGNSAHDGFCLLFHNGT